MNKILVAVPLALLALIAGLGLWGVTLPREHHASSRVTIAAPPEHNRTNIDYRRSRAPSPPGGARSIPSKPSPAPTAGNGGRRRWVVPNSP